MVVIVLVSWLRVVLGLIWVETCHDLEYGDTKRMASSKVRWLTIEEYTCLAQNTKDKKFLWVILARE